MSNINPNSYHFSQEDKRKIKHLINEGITINQEVEVLKEGLKEVVKDISDQMDIPVSTLNKAIRIAYKDSLRENRDEMEIIEELLEISGKGD